MIYLGIDVAKDKHECMIITDENKIVTPCFSFPNTREGFQRLDKEIRMASQGEYEKVKIGLEATGHYSSNLLTYLVRENWKVVQLNPLSVANFKKAQSLRRTKTDKNDVRYIAEMMLSDRNKPYQEQEYHISVLKSITRARYRISKELQHIKGRFRRSLHLLFPEYPKLFGVLYRGAALNLLAEYPSAKDIAELHLTTLTNFLKSHTHGVLGREKAILLKETAKNSIAYYSEGDALELKMLAQRILFMQNQRKELDKKIDEIMTKINSPITTIPGIGNYIGAVILAEIGDINNFETPAKLQAYAGADPAIYQSGTYTAANTAMVKRGSAYLRHALYLATCMASFADNSFARYAAKKKAQGKHHYVAMAHVMKKMIRVIFCVLNSGKDYVEPTI